MFATFFYNPIYNLIVFLLEYIPDLGIVIIITTLIIKLILFPLYTSQIKTQIATKKAKPELDALKEKYGKNITPEKKQKMMFETMAIYKKHKLKPFTTIFILLLQIPIFIALYFIFYSGGLPEIKSEILYSFISIPENISMYLLGAIDLTKTSLLIAFLAGLTQFIHLSISMPDIKFSDIYKKKKPVNNLKEKIKDDLMNSVQVNMKYGLPVFIFIILATFLNAAIAIYWTTSNIFSIFQELIIRKRKAELKTIDQK